MEYDIGDKVIVVTGAGRGLGRALALGLAREGARVAVLTSDKDEADEADAALRSITAPERVLTLCVDVSDENQVRDAATAVDQQWGQVDGLVNNAAIMPAMTPVVDLDVELFRRVIDVNLIGCFLTTKHFAPLMIRDGGGRIVYISSMIGVQANPGQAAYGTSKAGLTLLSNVVHRELADKGIRTVALAPGLTDTPGMRAIASDEYIERVASAYPGGRIGQPEDIVAFVAFLCSNAAQHLSGTLLPIRPVTG
ncbi:SDR family NAD(P)-dependent oxidoreductase [Amycolatopsis cynarae]|uniref:SDR family NAD(P)-dependent oxidoreductase n=1 Tax=Amycolatopsis cynarae TaxID=2995223 RepID=A0ABY7B9X0_9PSEU|nr:SDR family oxidoreductase [Amycolatopsis sp. HUAS 11-8]WAL68772.1 SDR family NAD(P)-dependent oxidoreductase [Amycolatopsis sp. HUAS 11-8]